MTAPLVKFGAYERVPLKVVDDAAQIGEVLARTDARLLELVALANRHPVGDLTRLIDTDWELLAEGMAVVRSECHTAANTTPPEESTP